MHYFHVVVDAPDDLPNSVDAFLVAHEDKVKAKGLAVKIAITIKQAIAYIPTEEYVASEPERGENITVLDVRQNIGKIRIYYTEINNLPQLRVVKSIDELQIIDDINDTHTVEKYTEIE